MKTKKKYLFLLFFVVVFISGCEFQKKTFADKKQPKAEQGQNNPVGGDNSSATDNSNNSGDSTNSGSSGDNQPSDDNSGNTDNSSATDNSNNSGDSNNSGSSGDNQPSDDNSDNTNNSSATDNSNNSGDSTNSGNSGDNQPSDDNSGNTDNSSATDDAWRIQNPSLPSGKFIFNLKGFDDKSGTQNKASEIAFTFGVGYSSSSKSTADGTISNGKNIFGNISRDGKFRFYAFGNPADPTAFGQPQNCTIDFPIDNVFRTSKGGDLVVNMNCITAASLVALGSTVNSNELEFSPNAKYQVAATGLKLANGELIGSDKFLYESTNTAVASVDAKGVISLKSLGDFAIKVKANPDFYTSNDLVVYKYKSAKNESGVFIQDIHLGQSSILPADSNYQHLAANKETLVRLFVYAQSQNKQMPTASLVFTRTNGEEFDKPLQCPPTLKKDKYTLPDYQLQNSCYAIMQSPQELEFIEEGVQIKAQVFAKEATLSKSIVAKVAQKSILNLYLVKGKIERTNAYGNVLEGYVAEVSNEDIKAMKRFLHSAFPLSQVNIRVRDEVLKLDANLQGALGQMEKIQNFETKNGEFAYALVPEFRAFGGGGDLNGLGAGLSRVNGGPSVGRNKTAVNTSGGSDTAYLKIMAHELGHAFGLYHAPCGPGNVQQVFDPFWKQRPEAWKHSSKGILSATPMYVPEQKILVSAPATINGDRNPFINGPADLMGYCDGFRLSKHNYKYVAEKISQHPYFRASLPNANIHNRSASGNLHKIIIKGKLEEGQILLEPVQKTTANLVGIKGEDFGYHLLIKTAQATKSYPISFIPLDHRNSAEFELILPDLGKITSLEFRQGTEVIDYKIAGLSAEEQKVLNYVEEELNTNLISYDPMTKTINWHKNYKFMTLVFHSFNDKSFDEKKLIVSNAEGGSYKIRQNLGRGFLQISLSDGINTYIESFFYK